MTEKWKAVEGYENRYEVSDHGRVRSFLRKKSGIECASPQRVLRSNLRGNAIKYPAVVLYSPDGGRKTFSVHILVARAFIGPCPVAKEVNHINGIPTDPSLQNLEYVTKTENMLHAYKIGTHKPLPPRPFCPNGHENIPENRIGKRRVCRICWITKRRNYRNGRGWTL